MLNGSNPHKGGGVGKWRVPGPYILYHFLFPGQVFVVINQVQEEMKTIKIAIKSLRPQHNVELVEDGSEQLPCSTSPLRDLEQLFEVEQLIRTDESFKKKIVSFHFTCSSSIKY